MGRALLCTIAALAAAAWLAGAGAAANLATDPGVETDPAGAWTTNGAASFVWDGTTAHDGSHSLKIVSTQPPGTLTRWMTVSSLIPVTPGRRYTVAAWLATRDVGGSARLAATFFDGSTYLPSTGSEALYGTNGFTLRTVEAVAPAGAKSLRVEYRLSGPGTLWGDDLSVFEGTPPGEPPANVTPPSFTDQDPGSLTQRTLLGDPGTWTGAAPTTFAYQWEFCDVEVGVCEPIPGQTGRSMTITVGPTISFNYYALLVTATNLVGSSSARSERVIVGPGTFGPVDVGRPRLGGLPHVGEVLTSGVGDWVGLGRGGVGFHYYAIGWQRCAADGSGCVDVVAPADVWPRNVAYYTVTAADLGSRLRAVVLATADYPGPPTVTAYSDETEPVQAVPNLAPDPTFDDDPSGSYDSLGGATFSWASDESRSGTHSLEIVSHEQALERWMSRTALIPVTPGRTYTVDAWFLTGYGTTGTATLAATFYDGRFLPSTSSEPLSGLSGWTERTVTATAPPGATNLRVEFRLSGAGALWVDDVTVTER